MKFELLPVWTDEGGDTLRLTYEDNRHGLDVTFVLSREKGVCREVWEDDDAEEPTLVPVPDLAVALIDVFNEYMKASFSSLT